MCISFSLEQWDGPLSYGEETREVSSIAAIGRPYQLHEVKSINPQA